jgi:FK506-binding nuclear protein
LTLVPGEKYPIYVRNDFQITNAALSEELASKDGRSVLKVTHVPVNPAMYDDSDSELDSDEEFGDEDVPEEDEFELDVEEGFKEVEKSAKKGKKVNGDVSMEAEDEEEEESDEDEDFSDDEEEVTNVICALTAGRVSQLSLRSVRSVYM